MIYVKMHKLRKNEQLSIRLSRSGRYGDQVTRVFNGQCLALQ